MYYVCILSYTHTLPGYSFLDLPFVIEHELSMCVWCLCMNTSVEYTPVLCASSHRLVGGAFLTRIVSCTTHTHLKPHI